MLTYQRWLKRFTFQKKNDIEALKATEMAIEKFLTENIQYMTRTQSNNSENGKIHKQLHLAENINCYGAHHNIHTGPQEHNHIDNTKKQVNRCKGRN